ncbi:MAG: hypothetical protein Q9201_000989 [Fulgogasparrea decipioides]
MARIILNRRPLRPPNPKTQVPGLRLFTQNSQLLLVSRTAPRPELPYLYVSSASRFQQSSFPPPHQNRLSRYLTTDRKEYIKSEAKLTIKYILIGNGLLFLGVVLFWLVSVEFTERIYPTPHEWTDKSRNIYRTAHLVEDPETSEIIDWPQIGNNYWVVLSRLEDPSLDGKGLPKSPDEDRVYVVGIDALGFSRKGLDVSSKSEEWRRGYHAALMKAARAAEHLDECVRDTTRNITFPKVHMIGPSNLRPKPVPLGSYAAPLEENCIPASETPQTFYTKILTSTGFTSGQRLDAALAYADWLDFKGLHDTAEEMYDWGLDIAMEALPKGVNNIVNTQTGIINSNATYVSNNLLRATTALAVHHAQTNNLSAALPIFLSVLRARKQLSLPPVVDPSPVPTQEPSQWETIQSTIKSIVISPPYPPPPPTGDEAPIRTPKAVCEEAATMAHIGEILFASANDEVKPLKKATKSQTTSQKQQSGLSWTRDAVDISEATLSTMAQDDVEGRQTCTECLETSINNWSKMVRRMLKDQQEVTNMKEEKVGKDRGWFWETRSTKEAEEDEGRWERELQLVEERMTSIQRLLDVEENARKSKGSGGIFGFFR